MGLTRLLVSSLLALTFATVAASSDQVELALNAANSGRFSEAVRLLEPLAQSGNADAEFILGRMYARGDGVQRDLVRARKYFESASAKGHQGAKEKLSLMNKLGHGLAPEAAQVAKAVEQEQKPNRVYFDTGDKGVDEKLNSFDSTVEKTVTEIVNNPLVRQRVKEGVFRTTLAVFEEHLRGTLRQTALAQYPNEENLEKEAERLRRLCSSGCDVNNIRSVRRDEELAALTDNEQYKAAMIAGPGARYKAHIAYETKQKQEAEEKERTKQTVDEVIAKAFNSWKAKQPLGANQLTSVVGINLGESLTEAMTKLGAPCSHYTDVLEMVLKQKAGMDQIKGAVSSKDEERTMICKGGTLNILGQQAEIILGYDEGITGRTVQELALVFRNSSTNETFELLSKTLREKYGEPCDFGRGVNSTHNRSENTVHFAGYQVELDYSSHPLVLLYRNQSRAENRRHKINSLRDEAAEKERAQNTVIGADAL